MYGGGNDSKYRQATQVMKDYRILLKTISSLCPTAKVIIMQIPPRNHHGKNPGSQFRINIVNKSLHMHVRDHYMSKTPATLHESHQMEMINPDQSDAK